MRRISSLPTAEFCPRVDKIGQDVDTTQSARSTVFHAYCNTGVWSDDINRLPEADREEIQRWRVPMPFFYTVGDVRHTLQYKSAIREVRVAVDKDFNYVDVPMEVPQTEIAEKFPHVMICGHLDMAWVLRDNDLVIIEDIKSSIFAVKERCKSLQLHGYGQAVCAKYGIGRYITAIWDATDGRHYVDDHAVEVDGFESADIRDRIRLAATERDGGFLTGTHCSSCWKRSHCPAHLVDAPEGDFQALLSGKAREKDVREALIKLKQRQDLTKRVESSIKDWVREHGPVRSEDGKKQYRCEMRDGRDGLDKEAIMRDLGVKNLDAYTKKGQDFSHFDWRNVS